MPRGKRDGLVIIGGGAAGSLAALAMAKARPEIPILLIEETERFGGNTIWSFFDAAISAEDKWLVDPFAPMHWPGFYVSFPGFSRKIRSACSSVTSDDLDRAVRAQLRPDQYRLGTKAVAVRETEVVLPGGERIVADGAIDARGAANLSALKLGWRLLLAREYRFPRPHRVDLPVLADATVDQAEGCRFVRLLPLSDDRLLIEDTMLSERPDLDGHAFGARLEAYVELRGWRSGEILREHWAVLPLALSDDVGGLWRLGGARVAKLGARGGFFDPVSGYSFTDAVRTAVLLTKLRDFSGDALHDFFQGQAEQLWKKREFYRDFNAALFAASNWDRQRVLASLHQLEPATIERFQSGRLSVIDRMRIGSLKTPKPDR